MLNKALVAEYVNLNNQTQPFNLTLRAKEDKTNDTKRTFCLKMK